MDAALQDRHRQRVATLNATPPATDAAAWTPHYAADALLVKPDGQVLRGLAQVVAYLNDQAARPVELELLQAERLGDSGYTVAVYKTAGHPPRTGTAFTVYTESAGALLVSADVYGGALLPRALDEWKECRTSIDRFDKLIVDVRKYGFTLITGLLTASAFAFVKLDSVSVPDAARVGVSLVLMVLVLGLFTVDRYLEIFLRSAVTRARALETALDFRLTRMISNVAEGAETSTWATWLYTFFMLCAIVPWVVATTDPWRSPLAIATTPGPARVVTFIGLAFTASLWIYHAWTRLGLRAGLAETTKRQIVREMLGKLW